MALKETFIEPGPDPIKKISCIKLCFAHLKHSNYLGLFLPAERKSIFTLKFVVLDRCVWSLSKS